MIKSFKTRLYIFAVEEKRNMLKLLKLILNSMADVWFVISDIDELRQVDKKIAKRY